MPDTIEHQGEPAAPAPVETPAAPEQGTPEPAPQQQQRGGDTLDRILDHQAALGRQLEQLRPQATPEPQAGAEPEPAEEDLEAAARALFGGADPDQPAAGDNLYDPDEGIDLEGLVGLIQKSNKQAALTAAQQAIQPLLERELERDRDEQFASLEDRLPRLREPEVQDAVIKAAADSAARLGNADLLFQPDFIELAYMAHVAREAAAGQQPAQPQSGLESADGANPGAAAPGPDDEADAIVKAGGPGSQFWGF